MVMNSRLPCRSITVSWMTWRVAKPAAVIWMRSSFWPLALCPSLASVARAHRLQRGEARPLDRAHHARAVAHVERGVDRDPDEANADHAGKTGAGQPFQPAACSIGARFAEIDRRQLALGPWHLAKKDGWESGSCGRHQGLAELTTRKATAAPKQSAFPPSIGRRPHACSRARTSRPGGQHRSGCCPSSEAGSSPTGGCFPSRSS